MNGLFRIHAVRAIIDLQLQVTDAVILRPNLLYEHAMKCISVLEIISSDLKAPQEQQFNDASIPSVPSVPVVSSEIFTCTILACGIICVRRRQMIHSSCSSDPVMRRHSAMARSAMQSLDRHLWTSRITNKIKLYLYRVFLW